MAGYGNIGDFAGREGRFDFWAYALPVFVVVFAISPVIGTAIVPFDDGDLAAEEFSADTVVAVRTTLFVLVMGLLAAKVRRRLRDAGRGIVWAMLVVIPYGAVTVGSALVGARRSSPPVLILGNAATLALLLALIFVLLLPEPGGDWRPRPLR